MTDMEIEIIKAEYEHHEKLLSEIGSNKSYGGAMASIAAFVVLEWIRSTPTPSPLYVVPAVVTLAGSSVCFFLLCLSEGYKFPSQAENWRDWYRDRHKELLAGGFSDTSEQELKDLYYRRLEVGVATNRGLIIKRQKRSEWAGIFAMVAILIVVAHVVLRTTFF